MKAPNTVFPHDHPLEIPTLLHERQGDFVDLPCYGWCGAGSRQAKKAASWHFYIADKNFLALLKHPEKPLETDALTFIEPNFSLDEDTPRPLGLYYIFWKRHLARYWQSDDRRIYVDLDVPSKFVEDNLLGVPEGWQAYATRGNHPGTKEELWARLDRDMEAALGRAGDSIVDLTVFHGGERTREWCRTNRARYIPNNRNYEH